MLLSFSALLTAVSGYAGVCRDLDPSTYILGMVTSWGDGEQPKIEFDWDNDNKFQDFVANDETYLLFHFSQDLALISHTINQFYPINQNGGDHFDGCTDCPGMLVGGAGNGAGGFGWTENNVLWFEMEDNESGRDLNTGSQSNQYMEWQFLAKAGGGCAWAFGFHWIGCLTKIQMCQGISPTQTGTVAGNVPYDPSPIAYEVLDPTDGENVHYNAMWKQTRTLHMAFSGTVPVNADSYIQAGFDGAIFENTIFSPMDFMEQPDPSVNVYNFHFDGDYCLPNGCTGNDRSGGEWYMNFHVTFTGSMWHRPTVHWVTVVNPFDSGSAPTTAAATTAAATTAAPTAAPTTAAPGPTTAAPAPGTTAPPPPTGFPLAYGTCFSGNWSLYMNEDDPSDGVDDNTLAFYRTGNHTLCDEIASVQVRDPANPDATSTMQVLVGDELTGITCSDADQGGDTCIDYEVRFCCEGRVRTVGHRLFIIFFEQKAYFVC